MTYPSLTEIHTNTVESGAVTSYYFYVDLSSIPHLRRSRDAPPQFFPHFPALRNDLKTAFESGGISGYLTNRLI
ncbi:hypothetical protein OLMES_3733 [Oleiphilus messinensis]|uniref:Uncharacterized protein n=1 Tax=Oleiphilus messinensis TaxID=141451 RepID=A0A1Y0IEF4_9GAMM|nr:hypothetical protein OLMES_3733 [Oleiphilus messinensis]